MATDFYGATQMGGAELAVLHLKLELITAEIVHQRHGIGLIHRGR